MVQQYTILDIPRNCTSTLDPPRSRIQSAVGCSGAANNPPHLTAVWEWTRLICLRVQRHPPPRRCGSATCLAHCVPISRPMDMCIKYPTKMLNTAAHLPLTTFSFQTTYLIRNSKTNFAFTVKIFCYVFLNVWTSFFIITLTQFIYVQEHIFLSTYCQRKEPNRSSDISGCAGD
jgi:hypothetical protein